MPMVLTFPSCGYVSAADAFAEGAEAGIGGWFLANGSASDPLLAGWFSLKITQADLAPFVEVQGDLQKIISGLETLAQTALLVAMHREGGLRSGTFTAHLQSDNAPTVGGVNKLCSSAWPQAFFIQNIASWAAFLRLHLDVAHLPGVDNVWADGLSRGFPDTLSLFEQKNRCLLSVTDLLHLPEATVSEHFKCQSSNLTAFRSSLKDTA